MVSNCVINGQPVGFEEPMVVGNDISTETLRKQVGPHVKLEREFAWVEFRFPGTKMDALGLIKESHLAISEFASKLKAALP